MTCYDRLVKWTTGILLVLLFHGYGQQAWNYDPVLQPDVKFWNTVFADYHSNQYILHDSENLKIVYKIVTFDVSISEYYQERQLEQIKEEIENILLKLSRVPEDSTRNSHLENYILSQFGPESRPSDFAKAARQIRAQRGMKDKFEEGLGRALAYLPYIKEVFRQNGLPEELAYLPHIESSFNPSARSKVGAAGLWQFMRSTGRLYLKINNIIDERYDPLVSTRAAARLLKYNYTQIGDWGLAITAYNFGLAGIKKAVSVHGPDYLKVRESFNHRKFKFASRNFYPEFLAVIEIMKNYSVHFPGIAPVEIPVTIRYQLKNPAKFSDLAERLNLDQKNLMKINSSYTSRAVKDRVTIPAGYWIYLPAQTDLATLEIHVQPSGEPSGKPGRSAVSLEEKKNSRIPEVSSSSAKGSDKISPGQVPAFAYRKPGVISESLSRAPVAEKWEEIFLQKSPNQQSILEEFRTEVLPKLMVTGESVAVFANETLGHYSDWLRIPLSRLQQINQMGRRKTIFQGQRLRLDFSRVSREEFSRRRYEHHLDIINGFITEKEFVNFIEYQVGAGESVWDLARNRYQIPLEIIQYFNMNTDINKLYPGDVIRIPIPQNHKALEETL